MFLKCIKEFLLECSCKFRQFNYMSRRAYIYSRKTFTKLKIVIVSEKWRHSPNRCWMVFVSRASNASRLSTYANSTPSVNPLSFDMTSRHSKYAHAAWCCSCCISASLWRWRRYTCSVSFNLQNLLPVLRFVLICCWCMYIIRIDNLHVQVHTCTHSVINSRCEFQLSSVHV